MNDSKIVLMKGENNILNHITEYVLKMSRVYLLYICIRTLTIFVSEHDIYLWGVRGRVVKAVDLKPLVPNRCGFQSRHGTLDSFM
jgi:hypothetical protein